MKKAINVAMLLLVVVAFSGVASASYISDSGHSTKHWSSGSVDYFTWDLVNYNKNSVMWRFYDRYYYKSGGTWYVHKVLINMPMYKYNGKVYATEYLYVNGHLKHVSTSHTGYTYRTAKTQFKAKKTAIIKASVNDCYKN